MLLTHETHSEFRRSSVSVRYHISDVYMMTIIVTDLGQAVVMVRLVCGGSFTEVQYGTEH